MPSRLSITPTLLFNSLHTLKQNTNEEDSRDYIISGSEDGKIWIWDIQSREMVASWQAHVDSVICVDYKKGFLASASLEKVRDNCFRCILFCLRLQCLCLGLRIRLQECGKWRETFVIIIGYVTLEIEIHRSTAALCLLLHAVSCLERFNQP